MAACRINSLFVPNSSFNKWWQEKRGGGLNIGHIIHAHLIGQLIIFVRQKIAVDFWTKRKCHLCVTGDKCWKSLSGFRCHRLGCHPTLWPMVPTFQRAEQQHLRRSSVRLALVWMWLQRQEIALALVKGLLGTARWEGRIKGVTCWSAEIQPSKWS